MCQSTLSKRSETKPLFPADEQLKYGKLSDIFGRRSNLTVAYTLFAVGCFLW